MPEYKITKWIRGTKPNFSSYVANLDGVRRVAAGLGFVLHGSRRDGDGSVRQLLEAIGTGKVLVMLHLYDKPGTMRRDADALRDLAGRIEQDNTYPPILSETLRRLAVALDEAAQIKEDMKSQAEE